MPSPPGSTSTVLSGSQSTDNTDHKRNEAENEDEEREEDEEKDEERDEDKDEDDHDDESEEKEKTLKRPTQQHDDTITFLLS